MATSRAQTAELARKNRQTGWVQSANDPNVLTQGPKPILGKRFTYKLNKETGSIDIYTPGLTGDVGVLNVSGTTGKTTSLEASRQFTPQILEQLRANAIKDSKVAMQNNASLEVKQRLNNSPVYKGILTGSTPVIGSSEASESAAQATSSSSITGSGIEEKEKSSNSLNQQNNNFIGKKSNKGYLTKLQYPEKMSGDRIQIEVCEYRKSGLQSAEGSYALTPASKRATQVLSTIFLPIQSGITDSMSVDWGNGEINPLTAMMAGISYGAINASGDGLGQGVQAFAAGLGNAAKKLQTTGGPEMQALLVNYFAQEAVGIQGLLSRTAGAAINNNMELLFNGPQLRSFTFNFRLTPRNSRESKAIKQIIRTFKIAMAPEASESQLFLLAPNVFKLTYLKASTSKTGGGREGDLDLHPYLNKFKTCALKDFSVNYTPDGQYMTYAADASMTAYELSMTFAEIDPVLANDYEDIESTSDGMGY